MNLLVTDLDGTLLRPDKTLGDRTIETVNRFVDRGGLFTYATARSYHSARRVTARLELQLPVITYGGAVTVDPRSGEADPAWCLDPEVVEEVLRLTAGSDRVQPLIFAMHEGRDRMCWLAGRETRGVLDFLAARPGDPRMLPLAGWAPIDRAEVFYITLIGTRDDVVPLHDVLGGRSHLTLGADIYDRTSWWLELSSPLATKAAAIDRLRKVVGASRLICFGDARNDLPMFEVADVAVAVANAEPSVRAAATDVIGPNSSEAVATWIASLG